MAPEFNGGLGLAGAPLLDYVNSIIETVAEIARCVSASGWAVVREFDRRQGKDPSFQEEPQQRSGMPVDRNQ